MTTDEMKLYLAEHVAEVDGDRAFYPLQKPCPDVECRRTGGFISWAHAREDGEWKYEQVPHPDCDGRGWVPDVTIEKLLVALPLMGLSLNINADGDGGGFSVRLSSYEPATSVTTLLAHEGLGFPFTEADTERVTLEAAVAALGSLAKGETP